MPSPLIGVITGLNVEAELLRSLEQKGLIRIGVAPNGFELHAVLGICFEAGCDASAALSRTHLQ